MIIFKPIQVHKHTPNALFYCASGSKKGSGQTGAFNKNQKETVTKYYLK